LNPIAIEIGPLAIRWYGILISSALAIGTFLAYREAKRQDIDPEHILNLVLLAAPAAIIGARLYYVIFSWRDYVHNPVEIFIVWHGGLAIHGGLLGGILVGYFYIRKHKLNFWQIADIVAPSIILGQAIGRWGNFFNQEAHGGPVSYEFISKFPGFIQEGMYIGGQYYHPTFLYESSWNLLVFLFLIFLRKRHSLPYGIVFLSYLVLYSLGRFYIEGLRTDSLMFGPIRVAQLLSLILIVGAGTVIFLKLKQNQSGRGKI